jgi:signal transduction histidine kinase
VETDLISELLELSRIKSRRQKMEYVDAEAICKDLGDVFDNDLRTRNIMLILDTHLPPITGERSRIRQVLQNLIDNAIKYMGDGQLREIHVGCAMAPTHAEFYVRDTGMGIEQEEIPKVFNVFRRGRSTGVQSVPGKGVGLASVKSIIEMYSGRIWVESVPGQGSTFKFTIDGEFISGCQNWRAPQPGVSDGTADDGVDRAAA